MSKIFFYSWRKDCLPNTLLSILVLNIIIVHLHHKLDIVLIHPLTNFSEAQYQGKAVTRQGLVGYVSRFAIGLGLNGTGLCVRR